jgi:hypothetical protein
MPHYKSDPYDYGKARWDTHMQAYSKNQRLAQQEGKVRIEKSSSGRERTVVPIDDREKTRAGKQNKNFGKPLPEHAYIFNIGGLAIPFSAYEKEEWDKLKPFGITVSGRIANPTGKNFFGAGFDIGKCYKVKLTNRTPEDNETEWILNATTVSQWEEFDGLTVELEEIPDYYTDFYCELNELNEYHESFASMNDDGTRSFSRRLVVTRGQAIDIILSDDPSNSHRLLLDDESLGFGAEGEEIPDSVTCWIPNDYEFQFGKYSEIYEFGTTNRSMKKDLSSDEYLDDEWNMTSIAIQGILVIDNVEPEDVDTEIIEEEQDDNIEIDIDESNPEAVEVPNIENAESSENTEKTKW